MGSIKTLLAALFFLIPLLEVYLLIQVGSLIGVWPTVGLVILTAMIGVTLLQQQGISTWINMQRKMAMGEMPAMEMIEGAFLLVGGALLLTPGFFTDTIGLLCLLPWTRRLIIRLMQKKLLRHVQLHATHIHTARGDAQIIEGEYKRDE